MSLIFLLVSYISTKTTVLILYCLFIKDVISISKKKDIENILF
jgi:hypothetical protein